MALVSGFHVMRHLGWSQRDTVAWIHIAPSLQTPLGLGLFHTQRMLVVIPGLARTPCLSGITKHRVSHCQIDFALHTFETDAGALRITTSIESIWWSIQLHCCNATFLSVCSCASCAKHHKDGERHPFEETEETEETWSDGQTTRDSTTLKQPKRPSG